LTLVRVCRVARDACRGQSVDRNSFRSPRGERDSGNVQPCPLGSTFVRTAIMLNLHQPAVTPCGRGRPALIRLRRRLPNSHPMRAGTPAHPGCTWFNHSAHRYKCSISTSPMARSAYRIVAVLILIEVEPPRTSAVTLARSQCGDREQAQSRSHVPNAATALHGGRRDDIRHRPPSGMTPLVRAQALPERVEAPAGLACLSPFPIPGAPG
jgi:hypothetical protein